MRWNKSLAGRLSPAQRDVLAALRAAGATVSVAYGLDAALAHLKHGLCYGVGGHGNFEDNPKRLGTIVEHADLRSASVRQSPQQ